MEEESDLGLSSALPSCSGVSLALAVSVPVGLCVLLDSPSPWSQLSRQPQGWEQCRTAAYASSPFIRATALIPVVTVEDNHSPLKGDPDVIIQRKENERWLVPKPSTVLYSPAPLWAIGWATNLASSLWMGGLGPGFWLSLPLAIWVLTLLKESPTHSSFSDPIPSLGLRACGSSGGVSGSPQSPPEPSHKTFTSVYNALLERS